MAMQPTEIEEDPFESLGARLGFAYQDGGAEKFKALMADIVQGGRFDSEHMEEASAELAALGLSKPAKLVAEAAIQCPSLTDMRFCPYTVEPYVDSPGNTANVAMWLRRQQRVIERIRKRITELLRRAGLSPESVNLTDQSH
jgi:hypothetical protein